METAEQIKEQAAPVSWRKRHPRMTEFLMDALFLNVGVLLMSVGVYFFKMKNGFTTGGVSGLALTVSWMLGGRLTPATLMLLMNLLLLVLGFVFLGREVGIKTVYCSLMFSLQTQALELWVPLSAPLTDDPFMELVYAILLTAVGSSLLFYRAASSGGTDITAMILKKYTRLDIGKALLACDLLIACTSFFSYGLKIGLYSVLGLLAKAFLVDTVIESISVCKSFQIVTDRADEVCDYILHIIHHGVTSVDAVGAYTGNRKKIIITACRRAEAVKLEKKLREIDPHAFITVTNSSKIIGRGFRGV